MLSRSGIHAVRALIYLAELPSGTYAGAVLIAETVGAPRNYLGKILQHLTRDGILASQRGLGGGFRLARPAKDIPLLDIVEPIEPISRWSGCILGRDQCSEETPCPIHCRWKEVKDVYMEFLTKTTIEDLVSHRRTVGE